jgi:hypothetical protein
VGAAGWANAVDATAAQARNETMGLGMMGRDKRAIGNVQDFLAGPWPTGRTVTS